ncbi:hypothetical protein GCM10010449_14510 [Streptomyces rectiviolaceus]|uniref:Uncharacterized protein n=2 Tax=Streptomyces rectiviolaceus TaxID=332591 RepID=A0ABP6M9K2_9ACTN
MITASPAVSHRAPDPARARAREARIRLCPPDFRRTRALPGPPVPPSQRSTPVRRGPQAQRKVADRPHAAELNQYSHPNKEPLVMPANDAAQAPIYDTLVQEHGDVLATARKAAEETQQRAEAVLDFRGPIAAVPDAPSAEPAA